MSAVLLKWTLTDAPGAADIDGLILGFAGMLLAQGIPVSRMNLPLWVRHPLVRVAGWLWTKTTATPDAAQVQHFSVTEVTLKWKQMYQNSPFPLVIEHGATFVRRRLADENCPMDFAILTDLRTAGVTDYLVLGGTIRRGDPVAMTFATDTPDGFSDEHVAALVEALPALLLHVDLRLGQELTEIICATYLGPRTGARVAAGSLRRGEVQHIDAVIGFCDLRGFTALSALRTPEEVTVLLNVWFDAINKQVHATGGEILKFIGDAALVIWPGNSRAVCMQALEAATTLPQVLPPGVEGGFAIHLGEVAYGNIGAEDRLDFTVIGAAVNIASRLEGLCGKLGVPWLVSDAVAGEVDGELTDLGLHALKGVKGPMRVWGPPFTPGAKTHEL